MVYIWTFIMSFLAQEMMIFYLDCCDLYVAIIFVPSKPTMVLISRIILV